MSAPPKTSDSEILSAARRILEANGLEAVTMQAVGHAVGIKAPSLYKRYDSRNHLLRALSEQALGQLRTELGCAALSRSARKNVAQMAAVYRQFAKRSPRVYDLIYSGNRSPEFDPGTAPRHAASARLLEILTGELDQRRALPAARLLVAFLHGFVSMELSGAFRLGGDVDDAFEFGLRTILDALFAHPS